MPSARCGYDGDGQAGEELLLQLGPTLIVDIGFDPTGLTRKEPPKLMMQGVRALIDTGATHCCIDNALALSLDLPICDQRRFGGIDGAHILNVHLAQMFVPDLGISFYDEFAGVNLAGSGQPHGAIIGRSFLRRFSMRYDGASGKVTLRPVKAKSSRR
jgi:hypothetical protein